MAFVRARTVCRTREWLEARIAYRSSALVPAAGFLGRTDGALHRSGSTGFEGGNA